MEWTIDNFKKGSRLSEGDTVVFVRNYYTIRYQINSDFLSNLYGSNDAIFSLLGLNKYSFCSRHYGYTTDSGDWPYFKNNDMFIANY